MKNTTSENFVKIPKIKLFCQISSIRGISKIHGAKTKFEKILWTGFVLLMTCVLVVTMVLLIQDYLQYITAWHTSTFLDHSTPFPAITVCGQNPFSLAANDYWLKRQIMSPSELQDNLTLMSLKAFDIPELEGLQLLRLYDLFSTFYMNLPLSDTVKLGHSKEMIRYCILIYKNDIEIAEKCDFENRNFSIKLFSHQEYFNCYTVEGTPSYTSDVIGLILLVQVIPSEKIPELSNSFLIDVLQRGEGLKVTVHEPQSYPDIENSGINMHPAKMNSLVYLPTKWSRLSTSKNPCRDNLPPIYDLDRKFKYSFTPCVSTEIQREIIEKCGCMLSNIPRPHPSNSSVPYCIKMVSPKESKIILDRFDCVERIKNQSVNIRQKMKNTQCFLRCQYITYETTMSMTRWAANELKLKSLENIYRSYFAYRHKQSKENTEKIKTILRQSLNYSKELKYQILNNKLNYSPSSKNIDENTFTYISLMRRNFDVQIKTEKLVLDSNTLLSRIGGLTSICIGLTAAVFAEFIEYIYWIIKSSFPKKSKSSTDSHSVKSDVIIESKRLIGLTLDENILRKEKVINDHLNYIQKNPSARSSSPYTYLNEDFTQLSLPNHSRKLTVGEKNDEYWIYN